MIRVLVVDDEELARKQLIAMLSGEIDLEIAGEARNGLEALERVAELNPDVVFLDIEMPGFNGFDVIRNLSHPPLIVFATAYDEYAVRAFDANAIDYILKPIQKARVQQAISKIRESLAAGRRDQNAALQDVLGVIKQQKRVPVSKLAARRGKRIILLGIRDVLYASIEDKLVFVHTASEKLLIDKTITELEDLLSDRGFYRIGRGELVNLEHVRELLPWFSGTYRIKLANGVELDVSRERSKELKERLGLT